MQYLNINNYRYETSFSEMQYACTCDTLSPDLCSYYFGSGDNDTDVVVFPLFHITDSPHSFLRSLQELLLHLGQLEASKPVIIYGAL
jgi:hypothetical protein